MDGIIPELSRADKRRLEKRCRKLKDGDQKSRYLIVLNLVEGRSVSDTAKALKVSRSTVYRVAARFREECEDGLGHRLSPAAVAMQSVWQGLHGPGAERDGQTEVRSYGLQHDRPVEVR